MASFWGAGGGGAPGAGTPGFKGTFATLPLLQAAFPTSNAGDFAWVGATKYEWDPVALAWVDPIAAADAIAKSDTAQAGESIAAGDYVYAAGKEWLNETVAPIVVPTPISIANMTAAGFTDVTGTDETWADLTPVADETARLALTAKRKPYVRVKQADTDEVYMQLVQPPTNANNWLLLSGRPTDRLFDGGDNLFDGATQMIEAA